jgi:hypothetical protein
VQRLVAVEADLLGNFAGRFISPRCTTPRRRELAEARGEVKRRRHTILCENACGSTSERVRVSPRQGRLSGPPGTNPETSAPLEAEAEERRAPDRAELVADPTLLRDDRGRQPFTSRATAAARLIGA